ncbi:MAG TPA: hypothetical protein VFW86_01985 [Candidatus Limnocylindrales bacterium]|nr:hypothetical protein [Candidatus Limnocylindrales bacterium]
MVGVLCFGLGIGLMARSDLGLGPWSVLHQGIGRQVGLELGTVDLLLSFPILVAFVPLGVRPGLGTFLTALLIGPATNVSQAAFPAPTDLPAQLVQMVAGCVAVGFGSALYLTARMGPGPRDGIMTGLHWRLDWRIGVVRTALESSVLVVGWLFGGTVGIGTVLYALLIGPVVEAALRVLDHEGTILRDRRLAAARRNP